MSVNSEMIALIFITLLLLVHIGGNLYRIKVKMDFCKLLKDHCKEQLEDKKHKVQETSLIFEQMPHCVFDKESNVLQDPDIVRYGELFRIYEMNGYFLLAHYVYNEGEDTIHENMELSELTTKEKDTFIENHKVTLKESISKELEEDKNHVSGFWNKITKGKYKRDKKRK